MPRDNNGAFYWSPGNDAVAGEPIRAAQFNTRMAEVAADMNTPRPISQGGTGAATPQGARTNLGAAEASRTAYTNAVNTFTARQVHAPTTNLKASYGGSLTGLIDFRNDVDAVLGYLTWAAGRVGIVVGTRIFNFLADGSLTVDGGTVYHSGNKPAPSDLGAVASTRWAIGAIAFARLNVGSLNANGIAAGENMTEMAVPGAGGALLPGATLPTGSTWRALSFCPSGAATLFIRVS